MSQQPKQEAGEKPVRTVQDLLERIRAADKAEGAVRAKLVMENTVPNQPAMPVVLDILTVRKRAAAGAAKPGAAKLDTWSRTDFQMKMPQGPIQVTTVRTPNGIRIHQSGAMTGEHWWKIDKELMTKLDTAAKKLGAEAPAGAGGPAPGALLGAQLLEGLTRKFDLELAKPASVDGVECYHVSGKAKEREDLPPGLKMLQPDKIDLYYGGPKHLVLRKMVQQREGVTLMSVSLRSVAVNDAVKYTDDEFELQPAGGKFQDIMEDPVASTRIRLMLQDLGKLEEEQRESETKGPKK